MQNKDTKKNVVYVFIFETDKVAYVGRTLNPSRREYTHKNDIIKKNKSKYVYNSPVYEYAKQNNVEIPDMKILEDNLTTKDSLIREDYWMSYYRKNGYTLLNRHPSGIFSGAAGEYEERYSDENLKELGELFDSLIEFKIKLPNTYKIIKDKGLLEKLGIPEHPNISNYNNDERNSDRNFGEMIQRMHKLLNLNKDKQD